jgi:DNA topoisomerase-1
VPTWLAFAVTRLLEEHFGRLVDYDFTAAMEEDLDRIASGQEDRAHWLSHFYFDSDGGLKPLVDDLGDIDARDINTVSIGDGIVLRVGRYGPYLEAPGEDGEEPRRASVPEDVAPDELTIEKARELLESNADGDRVLGSDPDTGRTIVARNGRFGPYVTEIVDEADGSVRKGGPKPRTGSLFKSMQVQTVGLDDALRLLSLPRLVGADPATGEEITAQNGRYGPYLKKGTDSRSLTSEDQIFDITLDEALAVYAQPKPRGRAASSAPLRELGADPVSGAPVVVKDGRFGPYVTDGTTNATLRKEDAVEGITLERAAELLADKRDRAPAGKRGARKTATKTATKAATKTATKAATAKTAVKPTKAAKAAKTAKTAKTAAKGATGTSKG